MISQLKNACAHSTYAATFCYFGFKTSFCVCKLRLTCVKTFCFHHFKAPPCDGTEKKGKTKRKD